MLPGSLLLKRFLGLAFVLTSLFSLPAAGQTFHDPRRKASVGFSVDLEYPAAAVISIVEKVANDKTIRGTKLSTKDHDMQIYGAEFATSSKVFGEAPASSSVFYKLKTNCVAPIHFPGSTGSGTVAVRYVVQPITPERTRLLIDAVFFEESLHARYYSDGNVEPLEYNEILVQLKALDSPKNTAASVPRPSGANVGGTGGGAAQPPAEDPGRAELQSKLADLQARLAQANATEQDLEKQVERLKYNNEGQIDTEGVPLKILPYNQAPTVVTLQKGEAVTVLATAKYWYRIKTPNGEEGWVYYVFLGPLS
jgi:hypothetical protein